MWGWLAVSWFGVIYILATYHKSNALFSIFKPLTLLLLFIILCISGNNEVQFVWIAIGLFLFMVADILELFPTTRLKTIFTLQLVAYLFYSKGLWVQLYDGISLGLPALLFAGSIILFLLLLPKLDAVIFPVVIMGLVSVQMIWAASAVLVGNHTLPDLYACIACLIFIVIALLRAISRNHISGHEDKWFTVGYFVAQSLIVASVVAQ